MSMQDFSLTPLVQSRSQVGHFCLCANIYSYEKLGVFVNSVIKQVQKINDSHKNWTCNQWRCLNELHKNQDSTLSFFQQTNLLIPTKVSIFLRPFFSRSLSLCLSLPLHLFLSLPLSFYLADFYFSFIRQFPFNPALNLSDHFGTLTLKLTVC